MGLRVAVFTDTYHPTVNGVTYVVDTWSQYWNEQYGQMDVVYPAHPDYTGSPTEHPVKSFPFPFYDGYRMGVPWAPRQVRDADLIHLHGLFSMGLAGWLLARYIDVPLIASYHTPTSEYSDYITPRGIGTTLAERALQRHERFALNRLDLVIVPSEVTETHITTTIGTDTRSEVISNGVDIETFRPVPDAAEDFKAKHDIDGPVIGYTGRHSTEKRLEQLIRACELLEPDITLVFGGAGPETDHLKTIANTSEVDIRFLGFLPREELPAFYSALDVFGFPSPVETEGIVAMEAIACGTPVVGVDEGALSETITHEQTGYLYPRGDLRAFADALDRALTTPELHEQCVAQRESLDVRRTLSELNDIYHGILE